ncbi:MAG: glycosyltransferase family 39 protein, partial [Anaerolineae bacterium]|nr:glycosyltransferase family 39 protein [Anaerolineae bacterium]
MKLGAKIALTPCLIVILLSCLVVQSIASSRTKSITFDEKVYITGGYHILKTGEYYFSCCHPPLIQALVASPLLLLDLKLPQIDGDLQRLDFIAQMDYSTQFFTENSDKVEEIALFSRSIIVAVSVITGLFVYAWAARLFGKKAGLFALFLYVFDPNIIAHSSIATLDLGFTALLFIGLFYLNRLIQHPNVRYFVTAGLML